MPLTPKKGSRNSLPEEPPKKQKSPQKPTVAGSFYSKQKVMYLTPLERKLLKETKSPPSKPIEEKPNPPPSAGTPKRKRGRPAKKVTASKVQKPSIKGYLTAKTSVFMVTPSTKTDTVSSGSEPSKISSMITFGHLKNKAKPKIFVGAAFFASGKKPATKNRMTVPWKPKHVEGQEKSKTKDPEKKSKEKEQKVRSPVRQAVFVRKPPRKDIPRLPAELTNTEQLKEVATDMSPAPVVASPRALLEKYGIRKDVRVVLSRSVSPSVSMSSPGSVCLALVRIFHCHSYAGVGVCCNFKCIVYI